MEKFLKLKLNVNLPVVDTQAAKLSLLIYPYFHIVCLCTLSNKLLVVTCDVAPFDAHAYQPVVEEYRKKRRCTNLRSEGADKGKWRKYVEGRRTWVWTLRKWGHLRKTSWSPLHKIGTQIQILVQILTPVLIPVDEQYFNLHQASVCYM